MRTSFEQAIRPNIFRSRPRANFAVSENKMSFAESEEARWRAKQKVRREAEKHLLGHDAVDTLLDGPVAKGVQKFRTPSGYTLSRTL